MLSETSHRWIWTTPQSEVGRRHSRFSFIGEDLNDGIHYPHITKQTCIDNGSRYICTDRNGGDIGCRDLAGGSAWISARKGSHGERGHPQADAIYVLGWIGVITLGVAWLVALAWAYTKPFGDAELRTRINELEGELGRLKDTRPKPGKSIVIAFLTICYAAFYWLFFIKLKLFAKSARNISIFVGIGVVLIGAIVFMWLTFAPNHPGWANVSVCHPDSADVKGTVIEVPVKPVVSV